MDQEPDQLRAQIDRQRGEISGTIDQIENRVNPSHVLARRQDSVKRRFTDWKDSVFGNAEPDYRQPGGRTTGSYDSADSEPGLGERMGDAAAAASDTVHHAPDAMRRQTRGNPMAAGAIAVGAGWLIGSLLPETRQEQRAVRKVEPQLSEAAATVKEEGRALADDLKEPAKHAADEVKQTGQEAASEVKHQGQQAAHEVKDQAGS